MSNWMWVYFLCGAGFGLATFSSKHLFSEGPQRRTEEADRGPLDGRWTWVLVCSGLWPIMALTGLYSFWRLRRQRMRTAREPGR